MINNKQGYYDRIKRIEESNGVGYYGEMCSSGK